MMYDIRKYKLAKIVNNDLPITIKAVSAAIETLEPYFRYKTVQRSLLVLKAEKEIMSSQLEFYKQMLVSKGKL